MSMMNWSASPFARSFASSGVAASALLTPNSGPYTSFMATNAAAMPAALWKNLRRLMPWCFASWVPSALMRASTCFCFAVCGRGENSSLATN